MSYDGWGGDDCRACNSLKNNIEKLKRSGKNNKLKIAKLEEAVKVLREMGEKYADIGSWSWADGDSGKQGVVMDGDDVDFIIDKDGCAGLHARLALKKVEEILK